MKKKLLSLVLAGAMVASTSVSAFAEDKTYTITDGGQEHQVTITGDVQNTEGNVVAGTISVTVPTAMAFTVTKDGAVEGGKIEVVNKGKEHVEVIAKEFTDTTPSTGIVLVKDGELDNKLDSSENTNSKRYMSLKLTGSNGSVGLVSAKSGNQTGFVDESGTEIQNTANTSLGSAWENNNLSLSISGRAKSNTTSTSYSAPNAPVQDTFNLVLKIQKTR